MLYHVTVIDDNQCDVPFMVFAVHAPEATPYRVITQACIDIINKEDADRAAEEPGYVPWDGQLDDPATKWEINPVKPIRLTDRQVSEYRNKLRV